MPLVSLESETQVHQVSHNPSKYYTSSCAASISDGGETTRTPVTTPYKGKTRRGFSYTVCVHIIDYQFVTPPQCERGWDVF